MATDARIPAVPRKRRRWKFRIICAAILVFLALVVFFNVGRWLVAEDPLRNAQSIVVLSGRMPSRAIEAARLYRQGLAPAVWLTHSDEPADYAATAPVD